MSHINLNLNFNSIGWNGTHLNFNTNVSLDLNFQTSTSLFMSVISDSVRSSIDELNKVIALFEQQRA